MVHLCMHLLYLILQQLVLLLAWQAVAQSITVCMLGTLGKLTMITHSFDIAWVRVGSIKSTTTVVHHYQAGPGVTHFYLKQCQTNEDLINVFLVLVLATLPCVYIHQDLGVYLSAFSPEMLHSMVVVITQNNITTRGGSLHNKEDYHWQMALEEYEHSMSASSHRKQNKDEL